MAASVALLVSTPLCMWFWPYRHLSDCLITLIDPAALMSVWFYKSLSLCHLPYPSPPSLLDGRGRVGGPSRRGWWGRSGKQSFFFLCHFLRNCQEQKENLPSSLPITSPPTHSNSAVEMFSDWFLSFVDFHCIGMQIWGRLQTHILLRWSFVAFVALN